MATPTTVDRPEGPAGDVPGGRRSPWAYLGVSVVIAVALMWLWIFSGAPARLNPDRLEDRDWAERAEETCRVTMDRIDERAAPAGRQDTEARADAIDASTADLEVMLARLATRLPESAEDRAVVEPWLADWDNLLEDRRRYAAAARVDPDARFLTSEKFRDGLDDVIGTFADVNDMPACGPAGDVG